MKILILTDKKYHHKCIFIIVDSIVQCEVAVVSTSR